VIYPTRRVIGLAAVGAPLGLLVSLAAPQAWVAALGWLAMVLVLMLVDALLATSTRGLSLSLEAPGSLGVGRVGAAVVRADFAGSAPSTIELAIGVNARLVADPVRQKAVVENGVARGPVRLTPARRGEGVFETLWARWRGPLGLVWMQRNETPNRVTPIVPDIQAVKDEALHLFTRDAAFGQKAQLDTGEGSDFHALKDFQTGMDLRAIDWKQSARHGKLIGREYRTERNHQIILALDSGRLMCAPTGGVPKIDRAINAALLLAFVSLKMGDRAGLFAFDAKPRVASGAAAGAQAFQLLQSLAASIDYSTEETNFTLGLTTLTGRLDRRALVVVFTDFADPTSAELMIENVGRLLRTHLVMFVIFRDDELEAMVSGEPTQPEDVARAVVADTLLKQREVVVARLRRMGAQIVDAPADAMGPALVNRYLDVKRRELL
jgi:uncharacterized protein (DUF58 family)